MAKKSRRIDTEDDAPATHNPFQALQSLQGLPAGPAEDAAPATTGADPLADRGRVDVIRQTAHRGGKAVTVVTNFEATSAAEKKALAKAMRKACGVGGTVKDGNIEIQGENREAVRGILEAAGYRPVFAGG